MHYCVKLEKHGLHGWRAMSYNKFQTWRGVFFFSCWTWFRLNFWQLMNENFVSYMYFIEAKYLEKSFKEMVQIKSRDIRIRELRCTAHLTIMQEIKQFHKKKKLKQLIPIETDQNWKGNTQCTMWGCVKRCSFLHMISKVYNCKWIIACAQQPCSLCVRLLTCTESWKLGQLIQAIVKLWTARYILVQSLQPEQW